MNTAELTALLNEDAAARINARTLANIARRAKTLWADGYKSEPFATGLYTVFAPAGDIYMVTCDTICGHDCTCPAFAKYGECKHHLAIKEAVEDPQAAAHDAEAAFDPYAEYEFRNFCEAVN